MISTLRATGFSLRTDPAWGYQHRGLSRCSPQKVPIRRCQAQKSGSKLALEELQASQSFSTNRVATVRSWGFLGVCTFVAAASLFSFNLLSQEIVSAAREQGYTGAPEDLLILDLRDGYTPETAFQAFKAWGGKGRALYALIEVVDVTCYATAYRGVFMVIINRLRSALCDQGAELPRSLALFPAVLAAIDYLEDSLQMLATLSFQDNLGDAPQAWRFLVQSASAVNVTKWSMVRVGTTCIVLALVAIVMLGVQDRLSRSSDNEA